MQNVLDFLVLYHSQSIVLSHHLFHICHVKLKEKNVTRHLKSLAWKVMKTSCRTMMESLSFIGPTIGFTNTNKGEN